MKLHIGKMYNTFDAHRHDVDAEKMSAYMLHKFPFFGIKAKPRRDLSKKHNQGFLLESKDFLAFAKTCFKYPEREMHHYCLDTLHASKKLFTADTLMVSEFIITNNSWWDTVDTANTLISLPIFKKDKKLHLATAMRWKEDENLWLRRSAIISQLKFRMDTDVDLLSSVIESNLGSDEFFINKAIGWALREYGDHNPEWVLDYANRTKLEPLSKREALRKIIGR